MSFDSSDATGLPASMKAVVTTGHGGYDRLVYRDVPLPRPGPGEVLVRVLAAGINNTDINTRLGWYSAEVTTGTQDTVDMKDRQALRRTDGGWAGATPFPLIQGTDCCGRVVSTHDPGDAPLIGQRVLIRPCMRTKGFSSPDTVWMAADFDGAFAEFVKVPAAEVFPVACDWSDAELATIPCAYGTAENMLHRARLGAGETVLVTGASGGVGSAAVQLARRRGARVIAVTSRDKIPALQSLGCEAVLDRAQLSRGGMAENSIDLVVDNVAGDNFARLPKLLRRGGRYVSSGAIGGPMVTLDMRDVYLKDLTLIGCTAWDEPVFPSLIAAVERGEIKPLLAGTFPLERIAEAQREFLQKRHVGNFVLVP